MEESIRQFLTELPMGPTAIGILIAAALIEYIFPPFPGDTVVLVGAILAAAAEWEPVTVLAAINLGSITGIYLDYKFGLYIRHHDKKWRLKYGFWNKTGRNIDKVIPLFERHPEFYLVINRFIPSIRAFFFIAAGIVEFPLWKVLILGGVSAFAWCLLLFFVGWQIGEDWERLTALFTNYQRFAWLVVAVVAVLAVRKIRSRNNQNA